MVDEFSSFARMPAPLMKPDDLANLCRQALFLHRNGTAGITFEGNIPDHRVELVCDGRLVGQALTNLLKNAIEAISARTEADPPPGHIVLRLILASDRHVVEVEDNGRGLPREDRDRLTEPYVTTRTKGTGLGLAIVKKIMEDHQGDLYLEDAPDGGARVGLVFPLTESAPPSASGDPTVSHGA
jgi:two-component system nitrogen regulation sensor histidine kinase NtrY